MSGAPSHAGPPPPEQVFLQMMMGKWVSKALSVAADLGVADHMSEAPAPVSKLAEQTRTDASSLYRLLRALAAVGVFAEAPGKAFGLTPVGRLLRSDSPTSMRAMARWVNCEPAWLAWNKLGFSVETGKPCFDEVYGQGAWEYFGTHADAAKIFNDAMTSFSGMMADAIVRGYDFSSIKHLCDIGGGHGALLGAILTKYPNLRGTLFDLPEVVKGAPARANVEVVGGDFFKAVPKGADAYIMKAIIHDWSDEHCQKLLSACREAMTPDGKVLVVEALITDGPESTVGKMLDLEMLAMTSGGRERTQTEFAELFARSGLKLARIVPTESPAVVIEAVRA